MFYTVEIGRKNGEVYAQVVTPDRVRPLPNFKKHSPTGFEYGYCGSGPAELAYTICLFMNKPELYQQFKSAVIAGFKGDGPFVMTFPELQTILARLERGIDDKDRLFKDIDGNEMNFSKKP